MTIVRLLTTNLKRIKVADKELLAVAVPNRRFVPTTDLSRCSN
jgi:hypothetical protein